MTEERSDLFRRISLDEAVARVNAGKNDMWTYEGSGVMRKISVFSNIHCGWAYSSLYDVDGLESKGKTYELRNVSVYVKEHADEPAE